MSLKEITAEDDLSPFDDLWFAREYERAYIPLDKPLPPPETLISIGEHQFKGNCYPTTVMTAGSFSVIAAPSKSKKTLFKTQLCATYIGGNASYRFPNIHSHRREDYYILDFDTEQSEYYAQRTFKSVADIVGTIYPQYLTFKICHLSAEERVAFIEKVLERFKGKVKLVFIDGIADLMNDVNNLEWSNQIVHKLIKWADDYKIHICTIIHVAYGVTKATGHLGSAVTKKAETVFLLKVDDNDKNIVEVLPQYTRGYPFDSFKFMVDSNDFTIYFYDEFTGQMAKPMGNIPREPIQERSNNAIPTASPSEAFGNEPDNGVLF
ncbi:MAG: AAA family ATPase [Capnocytophaga ochracea]